MADRQPSRRRSRPADHHRGRRAGGAAGRGRHRGRADRRRCATRTARRAGAADRRGQQPRRRRLRLRRAGGAGADAAGSPSGGPADRRSRATMGRARRPRGGSGTGRGRVPVGHPGAGRRHPDPERRCLRPGGRRRHRPGDGVRPRRSASCASSPGASAGSATAQPVQAEPDRWVVTEVEFELQHRGRARPCAYGELARALGIDPRTPRRRSKTVRAGGAGPAARQGNGARPDRSRHGQLRLVLHQPDPRSPGRLRGVIRAPGQEETSPLSPSRTGA